MAENSYGQILRSTGITGIAQGLQIILKVIGTKCAAIFIGPAGIGLMGLYQSTIDLIGTVSGVGLGTSAVRDIASAAGSGDKMQTGIISAAMKRLVLVTGIAGMFLAFIFSPQISKWIFGDTAHTTDFRILSVSILLMQLTSGRQVLIQGFRKMKEMALSAVIATLLNVGISIPLFYFYGLDAIIPVLIINALTYFILALYFSSKIKIDQQPITVKETWIKGKDMLRLGSVMMLTSVFLLFSLYQVRLLVNREMGLEYTGFFQASWGISIVYLQMIFQAMSKDYYPRLSALQNDAHKSVKLINEQLHIGMLIAAPILGILIVLSPHILTLLYSSAFVQAVPLFQWLLLGTIIKVFAWPIAFILPANRHSRIYLFTEASWCAGFWLICVLMISDYGIEAIGIAYCIMYALYAIVVLAVANTLIHFKLDATSIRILLLCGISITLLFLSAFIYPDVRLFTILNIALLTFLIFTCAGYLHRLTGFYNILQKFKSGQHAGK